MLFAALLLLYFLTCHRKSDISLHQWGLLPTIACTRAYQALLAFLSRREALTPIGAVEVLGDFDLAAGPHV